MAVLFGSFHSSIKCQITKHSKMFHVKHLFCLFGFFLNRKFYICTFVYSNDRIYKCLIVIYGFYFVFLYICFCCFIENEFDYTLKVEGSIRIVDFVVFWLLFRGYVSALSCVSALSRGVLMVVGAGWVMGVCRAMRVCRAVGVCRVVGVFMS